MPTAMTAAATLDREFLNIRCRVLDIAAALDRIDRAVEPGAVSSDPRVAKLRDAVGLLTDGKGDRAERVQMTFSDPYDENWRTS